jgi:hypothetical protein
MGKDTNIQWCDSTVNPTRPKQEVSADLVDRLMAIVRGQFCGQMTGKEWGQHSHFVRRNVILWPARFICNKKGFTLPGVRYEQIMRQIFSEIKANMTNAPIRYWPGYLMKCVQDHWRHHWEEYYNEAKAARNVAESTLIALGRLPIRSDSTVETLASVHKILTAKTKSRTKPAHTEPSFPGF